MRLATQSPTRAPSAPRSGLLTSRGAIPLRRTRVQAWITGPCARVTLTQSFHNTHPEPIEAVYAFPLPPEAAITAFEATIGPRTVQGHIQERQEAFDQYDDALADGHGAFLLEQHRPDVFTVSLGNLKPDARANVTLTYLTTLTAQGDALRFILPTTVAPRVTPGTAPHNTATATTTAASPTHHGQLSLQIHVRLDPALHALSSPTHPVRMAVGEDQMTVSLSNPNVALDRDFVLNIEPIDSHEPQATIAADEHGQTFALLTFYPDPSTLLADPRRVLLLVDTHTSMQGDALTLAQHIITGFLPALTASDTACLMTTQDAARNLLTDPQPIDAALGHTMTQALHRAELSAQHHLQAALRHLLGAQDPLQIVIITNGTTDQRPILTDLCRQLSAQHRVFVFGVGAAPRTHVIEAMAQAGSGAAEFIHPGEDIAQPILRMAARIGAPKLPPMELRWEGIGAQHAPSNLPALFGGDRLTVLARLDTQEPGHAVLSCGPQQWRLPIDPRHPKPDPTIGQLWARAAIGDMERRLERSAGSARRTNHSARRRQDILDLSRRYSILSSVTSFVAVETRQHSQRTTVPSTLRHVPAPALATDQLAAHFPAPLAEQPAARAGGPPPPSKAPGGGGLWLDTSPSAVPTGSESIAYGSTSSLDFKELESSLSMAQSIAKKRKQSSYEPPAASVLDTASLSPLAFEDDAEADLALSTEMLQDISAPPSQPSTAREELLAAEEDFDATRTLDAPAQAAPIAPSPAAVSRASLGHQTPINTGQFAPPSPQSAPMPAERMRAQDQLHPPPAAKSRASGSNALIIIAALIAIAAAVGALIWWLLTS